jgi:hypothetical protein
MITSMYWFLVGWLRSRGRPRVHRGTSFVFKWLKKPEVLTPLTWLLLQVNVSAQAAGSGDVNGGFQQGLGLLMKFGFLGGCVMVMAGFMAAKRDENWKMTVIYGLGVAGTVAILTALFNFFGVGGAAVKPSW